MGNEFNKTEADFTYERYNKMGGVSSEQDIPLEELRHLGTITEQSHSEDIEADDKRPLESALASHEQAHERPVDFVDGIADDGADQALVGDGYLAADIGLNQLEPGLGRRADREDIIASPAPERDELLESDAVFAAGAAGLGGGVIDYAEEGERLGDERPVSEEQLLVEEPDAYEESAADEEQPLEDIPDADEIQPGSAIDPASPPVDVMPGTDVLNGSNGEDDR
ncbi:hypothetical protein [Paenibacillus donghaensis]|uniref:DUF5709 domain-containing protein n=1 Tax=Paenibacillus donghaensis TaxID=414771 RepID=A0A2Z2KSQ9_9BACL|nr:hypothetical protein [Paenibacillus donghaensis]ASA26009.1 hypothetical protein B9T62_38065 [Paenibacillus donghaensis]